VCHGGRTLFLPERNDSQALIPRHELQRPIAAALPWSAEIIIVFSNG
jgi:hypothetical protein